MRETSVEQNGNPISSACSKNKWPPHWFSNKLMTRPNFSFFLFRYENVHNFVDIKKKLYASQKEKQSIFNRNVQIQNLCNATIFFLTINMSSSVIYTTNYIHDLYFWGERRREHEIPQ